MKLKIDKDIALPKKGTGRNPEYEFNNLEIGDSVFVKNKKRGVSYAAAFRLHIQRHHPNWEMAQRQVDGGMRIWRTK